jgi:hypothetical protein
LSSLGAIKCARGIIEQAAQVGEVREFTIVGESCLLTVALTSQSQLCCEEADNGETTGCQ